MLVRVSAETKHMSATNWMDEAQVTFWDGLIIASAEQQICSTVLSEDFQDGRQYARWWLASLKSARAIQ